jgi:hypothetical protein
LRFSSYGISRSLILNGFTKYKTITRTTICVFRELPCE